jgi:type 1 glutamine amidotransferase
MLASGSAALLGLASFPLGWTRAQDGRAAKLLYFTRSVEYEHSVIAPSVDGQSFSARILQKLGQQADFEIECSKDGQIFDGDLDRYDAIVFYSCGDLFDESVRKTPPMSRAGRKRLLDAVESGKPFIALHSSCYWGRKAAADDAYLAMVGAEFISHGEQQEATMKVASPKFPGTSELGSSFRILDEWYAMKNFQEDLHVILVQETAGMQGEMYQRPAFPSTWARMHGKGRVFYCAMGHREDVWTSSVFQNVLLGGLAWALGNAEADITPNIRSVTPQAEQLHA